MAKTRTSVSTFKRRIKNNRRLNNPKFLKEIAANKGKAFKVNFQKAAKEVIKEKKNK